MHLESIKGSCKICQNEASIDISCEPVYRIYHCKSCGRYLLLDELYDYADVSKMIYLKSAEKRNRLMSWLARFKENNLVDTENVLIVFGKSYDFERLQRSKEYEQLLEKYKIQFVDYSETFSDNQPVKF